MRLCQFLPLLFACSLCAAQGPPATFADAVRAAALPLTVEDGNLLGPGGEFLLREIAAARFVLLGETHFTREIPQFTTAVCNAMHPDAYAVEAGPEAAQFVGTQLRDPERIPHMRARLAAFPSNMAFLDALEENNTAAACAAASRNPAFALWGLDQEFFGAAGALLDSMAHTHAGPRATAAIATAKEQERRMASAAAVSGNPLGLYLIAVTDTDLQPLQAAVDADGTPATQRILHELTESRRIYRLNTAGDPDSNRVRNLLMKQHLLHAYLPVGSERPESRVLFKFGSMHMGKGFSPLHQREIGNTVAELADVEGATSLHISMVGVAGVAATFAGYGKPVKTTPFDLRTDKDAAWLLPAFAAMPSAAAKESGTSMTVFDLRRLRFMKGMTVPEQWRALIDSCDLLVLIPEVTPAALID